jgi:hypothetical protein
VLTILKKGSKVILPGFLGRSYGNKIEVIFMRIETLEKDAMIDPPDVRVLVDTITKEITWIHQM